VAAINQAIPVKVHLTTSMEIDGNQDHFEFAESGELIHLADHHHFLRYVEHQQGQATPVQIAINGDQVRLVRKGPRQTKLLFVENGETISKYQTEYGMIPLHVVCDRLIQAIDQEENRGQLEVHYRLKNNGQVLGTYRIKLQFES
jgi:uncharacterized beta-barrel protein YwiB (DUF1934 family)